MGRVTVPKTGQKDAVPRGDATEMLVGMVAVPKGGYESPLPRGDGTEVTVGMAAVLMPKLEPSVIPNLEDEFEADAKEESVAGFDSDESPVCSPGLYPGLCP